MILGGRSTWLSSVPQEVMGPERLLCRPGSVVL